MNEWFLPVISLLAVVLSVVGKTRTDSTSPLALPNFVGVLAIFLASGTLYLSWQAAQEDKGIINQISQDLSDSNQKVSQLQNALVDINSQNLILSLATHGPGRIIVDVPIVKSGKLQDVRDVFFPGWKSETGRYQLGSFDLEFESGHLKASGNFWLYRFHNLELSRIAALEFFHKSRTLRHDCVSNIIWNRLTGELKTQLEYALEVDYLVPSVGAKLHKELGELAHSEQHLFHGCKDLPVLVDVRSNLKYQEIAELNGVSIMYAFGEFGGRFTPFSFFGFAPDDSEFDSYDRVSKDNASFRSIDDSSYFSFELRLTGERTLADWYSDIAVGQSVLKLIYFEKIGGSVARSHLETEKIKAHWEKLLADKPMRLHFPINDSGSVSLVVLARKGEILESDDRLTVNWVIAGEPNIVAVDRNERSLR